MRTQPVCEANKSLDLWLKWWSDANGGKLPLYLSVYIVLPIINCTAIGAFVWYEQAIANVPF